MGKKNTPKLSQTEVFESRRETKVAMSGLTFNTTANVVAMNSSLFFGMKTANYSNDGWDPMIECNCLTRQVTFKTNPLLYRIILLNTGSFHPMLRMTSRNRIKTTMTTISRKYGIHYVSLYLVPSEIHHSVRDRENPEYTPLEGTFLIVILTTHIFMPLTTKYSLGWWLFPDDHTTKRWYFWSSKNHASSSASTSAPWSCFHQECPQKGKDMRER